MHEPTTPAALVSRDPRAASVLHRYGIEFCCRGGDLPFDQACRDRGVDPGTVLDAIRRAGRAEPVDWTTAPLGELIDHILRRHHRPLDEELPRLKSLAAKVRTAHPEAAALLADVQHTLGEIAGDLRAHMPKEEQVLFPLILAGQGAMAGAPISVMQHEHVRLGDLLERLRRLTGDYTVPDGACPSWTALWHGLDALEADLHVHVHLEDHVLFPRARATSGDAT